MSQHIVQLALVVHHYDEAIEFYTRKLHFVVLEDTVLSETKRWVVIAPAGSTGCKIVLAQAANDEQRKSVGNQTGGRVFLFMHTDNIEEDVRRMKQHQVKIVREITQEEFGKVCVFADLYGNLWDLIEPKLIHNS